MRIPAWESWNVEATSVPANWNGLHDVHILANDEVVNFETMRDMILNDATIKSKEPFQFKWDTKTKDTITKHVSRNIKSTVKEKRNIDGFDSKPSGWGGEHLMIGHVYL